MSNNILKILLLLIALYLGLVMVINTHEPNLKAVLIKMVIKDIKDSFKKFKQENQVTESFKIDDILAYADFTVVNDNRMIDDIPFRQSISCADPIIRCVSIKGTVIAYEKNSKFSKLSKYNAIRLLVDVNGKFDNTLIDNFDRTKSKSVPLFLFSDGEILPESNIPPNTISNGIRYKPNSWSMPSWYQN